jgi:salicylate hydroxylase
LQAHRKELLDIMTSFIPADKVRFNKRLTSILEDDEKLTLTFADGETVNASVLVGADGIQSTAREHVLKPHHSDEVAPVYAGSYCYRAVIPMSEAEDILGNLTDVAKFYFGHNRGVVTYRISGGKVRKRRTNSIGSMTCMTDDQLSSTGV